jgi:hypothetical protein
MIMSNAAKLTASQAKFIKTLANGPQPVKPSQVVMINSLVSAGLVVWRNDLKCGPTDVNGRMMYLHIAMASLA